MLKLSISGVNFEELNIKNLSKRGIFDSLKIFWNGDDMSYIDYLNSIGVDYFKTFENTFTFNKNLNEDIEKLKYAINAGNTGKFDFKAIPLFTNKNLPNLQDSQYIKLNIDLREIQDHTKISEIKDIFLTTPSSSLVEFKEVGEENLSIIFHRRGAMKYCNEYLLNMSKEKIQLIENYKIPKDNSFIVARFILDFSHKLKEAKINESFGYNYEQGSLTKEISKNVDEIIFWGNLSLDEKEKEKEKERENEEMKKNAKEIAKTEIKDERDSMRDSLPKDSTIKILQTEKQPPNVFNIASISENSKNDKEYKPQVNIEKIIEDSFSLYVQKEFEKTKMRLDRAQKDAKDAYNDLKEYLNQGLTINEALKNVAQKYRNEDTLNFASLLFTKDILNLKIKEQEINDLKNELNIANNTENELLEEITKREETISKLKGTIQLKVNEMVQLREDFEKEIKDLKEIDIKFQKLTEYSNEQDQIIADLNAENEELNEDIKNIQQDINNLTAKNQFMQEQINEYKERIGILEAENKKSYKLQIENENLKNKNEYLENEIKTIHMSENENFKLQLENQNLKEKEKFLQEKIYILQNTEPKKLRSKDILK